jgi:hypothetical protein
MRKRPFAVRIIIAFLLALPVAGVQAQDALRTENVILITMDGFRWQELFTGADEKLIDDEAFVEEPGILRERYWDNDPVTRRSKLMPFFWSVIAERGQLYGNRAYDNFVDVTNSHRFSYPGYNEILTGFADDRIDSNDKIDNANVTVLEYINGLDDFRGLVAAFSSWDVFPWIINEKRNGIPVNAGFRMAAEADLSQRERLLNELQPEIPSPWPTVRLDAFTHHYAMEYLRKHSPRLLFIAYGETDDFAHDAEYDQYLESAHRTDAFIGKIWNWVQSTDGYRDATTLIVTTDHGRGTEPRDAWERHGADIPGSEQIWLAVIGPDTKPLGEIQTSGRYYQDQVARTVATLLGTDYTGGGKAGKAIDAITGR